MLSDEQIVIQAKQILVNELKNPFFRVDSLTLKVQQKLMIPQQKAIYIIERLLEEYA